MLLLHLHSRHPWRSDSSNNALITIAELLAENAQSSPVWAGSNNALITVAELLAESDQSSPVRTGSNNALITFAGLL